MVVPADEFQEQKDSIISGKQAKGESVNKLLSGIKKLFVSDGKESIYDLYDKEDCLGAKNAYKDRYGVDIFPNPRRANIQQITSIRNKIAKIKQVEVPNTNM